MVDELNSVDEDALGLNGLISTLIENNQQQRRTSSPSNTIIVSPVKVLQKLCTSRLHWSRDINGHRDKKIPGSNGA